MRCRPGLQRGQDPPVAPEDYGGERAGALREAFALSGVPLHLKLRRSTPPSADGR